MSESTIWKYEIPIEDAFTIDLPVASKILHVGVQLGTAFMWVWVDPKARCEARRFFVVGTGHRILSERFGPGFDYIATFQIPPFVWHLFTSL